MRIRMSPSMGLMLWLSGCVLQAAAASAPWPALPNVGTPSPPGRAAVYLTSADLQQTLARQPDLSFRPGPGQGQTAIVVDASRRYQTLTAGFGVALNDTAAYLLKDALSPAASEQAMKLLFSPVDGIGLSYVRLGLGGTDYNATAQPYTYDDLPPGQSDPQLQSFSLDHDRAYIIPAARQALRLNPEVVFTTSPWSPPAWMKTDDQIVPSGAFSSRLRPDAYEAWAQYFVKFLKGYDEAGIHFAQVSLQNEPLNSLLTPLIKLEGGSGIPGLYLPPYDALALLRDHLHPALQANGLRPRILIWDYLWGSASPYIPDLLSWDPADVGGLAWHCYFGDPSVMSHNHVLYGLPQYETECASKLSTIEPAQTAIRALNNWAEGVQLWGAAVDTHGGPKFGSGCIGIPFSPFAGQDCTAPVTVDQQAASFTLTADFWALAQFSRFIRNGAIRIDATGLASCNRGIQCGLEGTAFLDPDGTRVLVMTSHDGHEVGFSVTEGDEHVDGTVPEGAIVTLVWRAPGRALRVQ